MNFGHSNRALALLVSWLIAMLTLGCEPRSPQPEIAVVATAGGGNKKLQIRVSKLGAGATVYASPFTAVVVSQISIDGEIIEPVYRDADLEMDYRTSPRHGNDSVSYELPIRHHEGRDMVMSRTDKPGQSIAIWDLTGRDHRRLKMMLWVNLPGSTDIRDHEVSVIAHREQ